MTSPAAKSPEKITYRLRLRAVDPEHDEDDIRHLRVVLKTLSRRYRFRVVELEREQTP